MIKIIRIKKELLMSNLWFRSNKCNPGLPVIIWKKHIHEVGILGRKTQKFLMIYCVYWVLILESGNHHSENMKIFLTEHNPIQIYYHNFPFYYPDRIFLFKFMSKLFQMEKQ